jgi:retron-type reverse transcriptase
MGVPQGGILSPLLSNIVLHELDIYISKLIEERKKENGPEPERVKNQEYYKLSKRMHDRRVKIKEKLEEVPVPRQRIGEIRKEIKTLLKKRNVMLTSVENPKHISYKYVRYADD